jgi:hypothetical protein
MESPQQQENGELGSINSAVSPASTPSLSLVEEEAEVGRRLQNETAVDESLQTSGSNTSVAKATLRNSQQDPTRFSQAHTHSSPAKNSPLSSLNITSNHSNIRAPFGKAKSLLVQKHKALEAASRTTAYARRHCNETLVKAFAMGNRVRDSKTPCNENKENANWYEKESLCELLEEVKKENEQAEKAEDMERKIRQEFVDASVRYYDDDLEGWR